MSRSQVSSITASDAMCYRYPMFPRDDKSELANLYMHIVNSLLPHFLHSLSNLMHLLQHLPVLLPVYPP